MDFSTIFQLKEKKFWWMDVILYFCVSLLISIAFCYLIFLGRNAILRSEISSKTEALQTVGNDVQKEQEKSVTTYQKKLADFSQLIKNHEFASNVFAFMQKETISNVWFKQFVLNEASREVQLSGESDDMDALSHQVAIFEKNEYVKNLGGLNSSLGNSSKIDFSLNLTLDPKIFNFVASLPAETPESSILQTASPSSQPAVPQSSASASEAGQKYITSFRLLLNPEVTATVNQFNLTINAQVPQGTDLTKIIPSIVASPGSVIYPASGMPQDFTKPIIYNVIAADGTNQNYTVTVSVAQPEATQKSSSGGIVVLVVFVVIILAIIATAVYLFRSKLKTKHAN